ncbi:MAG: hypothetical protein EB829_06025 [Nitrosopumilus sp. H8]|nr:MAG: hypothetical protein EB830_06865 [Nitrosopumilus sp. H13]RNJ77859.1 MAG: hypothetical protein EB829_06025 [Nitrosopumilus sp. H8]
MLSEKGKHASATENRRLVWTSIVWPLVLALRDIEFSLEQFQLMRDEVCRSCGIPVSATARGLVSLVQKGMLIRDGGTYSIHYRLIPYMRLGATCDYSTAILEVRTK